MPQPLKYREEEKKTTTASTRIGNRVDPSKASTRKSNRVSPFKSTQARATKGNKISIVPPDVEIAGVDGSNKADEAKRENDDAQADDHGVNNDVAQADKHLNSSGGSEYDEAQDNNHSNDSWGSKSYDNPGEDF